jgi:hypothetical protein
MRKAEKLFTNHKGSAAQWSRILFIDPGVRNLGYAFWEKLERRARPMKRKLIVPSKSGRVNAPSRKPWLDAVLDDQCGWFTSFLAYAQVDSVVIESAEVWSDSAVSMASATQGDLMKLTTLIGVLCHAFLIYNGRKPTLISPREWKGTMPKDVMEQRLRLAISGAGQHRQFSAHEADAVAMGISAQQLL